METGSRNRHGKFQQRAAGTDDAGQPNGAWQDVSGGGAWVNIAGETGMGVIRGGYPQNGVASAVGNYSLRSGYRTDITTGMRFVEDGTGDIYDVLLIQHDRAGHEYTDFICTLGGNNG